MNCGVRLATKRKELMKEQEDEITRLRCKLDRENDEFQEHYLAYEDQAKAAEVDKYRRQLEMLLLHSVTILVFIMVMRAYSS